MYNDGLTIRSDHEGEVNPMTQPLEFLTKYFHHPDYPLGENGLRAYWEARDAFSSTPPEARATDEDKIALAIAEQQLEDNQKCRCGLSQLNIDRTETGQNPRC